MWNCFVFQPFKSQLIVCNYINLKFWLFIDNRLFRGLLWEFNVYLGRFKRFLYSTFVWDLFYNSFDWIWLFDKNISTKSTNTWKLFLQPVRLIRSLNATKTFIFFMTIKILLHQISKPACFLKTFFFSQLLNK